MVLLSKAGLVSAYVLIALLLLSALLYTKWPWRLKALSVALVSAFYLITYYSFPPLFGWPTDEPLPKRFNLVAIYVQEPNKSSGDDGEIFLWATNLENGPTRQEPRSYRLPFSGELHSKVVEAGTKMRKGLPQLGEIVEKNLGPHGKPTDEDQGGQKSIDIDFFDLPDPLFPEK